MARAELGEYVLCVPGVGVRMRLFMGLGMAKSKAEALTSAGTPEGVIRRWD